MDKPFHFWRESDGFCDRLNAYVQGDETLTLSCADKAKGEPFLRQSMIDLPAADARRLRDWLRERYPETDTGETK